MAQQSPCRRRAIWAHRAKAAERPPEPVVASPWSSQAEVIAHHLDEIRRTRDNAATGPMRDVGQMFEAADDLTALRKDAQELGIKVDFRWGPRTLQREIDLALSRQS